MSWVLWGEPFCTEPYGSVHGYVRFHTRFCIQFYKEPAGRGGGTSTLPPLRNLSSHGYHGRYIFWFVDDLQHHAQTESAQHSQRHLYDFAAVGAEDRSVPMISEMGGATMAPRIGDRQSKAHWAWTWRPRSRGGPEGLWVSGGTS